MTESLLTSPDTYVPSESDAREAVLSSRQLASVGVSPRVSLSLNVEVNGKREVVPLPNSMVRLLTDILTNIAQGSAITLFPTHAELTTQQAADLLNVSRPTVIQLVQAGKLPHHMAGTHRRIKFRDLMEFKRDQAIVSRQALDELAQEAQELDMGY